MANLGLKHLHKVRFASPLWLSFEPILLLGPPFWPSWIMAITVNKGNFWGQWWWWRGGRSRGDWSVSAGRCSFHTAFTAGQHVGSAVHVTLTLQAPTLFGKDKGKTRKQWGLVPGYYELFNLYDLFSLYGILWTIDYASDMCGYSGSWWICWWYLVEYMFVSYCDVLFSL
jgi:hypothetical protein